MLIFAIDDEPLLAAASMRIIQEAKPEAQVLSFLRAADALKAISESGLKPDVVFSDIQMPGISGLELAVRLKTLSPSTKIVFVTGYEQYALDAFRVHAHGYLLKPLDVDQVLEELERLPPPASPRPDRICVRCFGYFDVFWKGQPLAFNRRKTRELFAFLIDREGTVCTPEDIASALWENECNMKAAKNRIRVLISDLRSTLSEIGMESLIIRRSGWIAIRRELVDCDYYRMLDGEMAAVNSYRGEYMLQYSWAELTAGKLHFRFLSPD